MLLHRLLRVRQLVMPRPPPPWSSAVADVCWSVEHFSVVKRASWPEVVSADPVGSGSRLQVLERQNRDEIITRQFSTPTPNPSG